MVGVAWEPLMAVVLGSAVTLQSWQVSQIIKLKVGQERLKAEVLE